MKSSKNLERRLYFKILLYILAIITVFGAASIVATKYYKDYKYHNEIDSIQVKHQNKIDSLQLEKSILQELKNVEAEKVDSLSNKIKEFELRTSILKRENGKLQQRADSLEQYVDSEICREIVDAFKEVNDSIRSENSLLDSTVIILNEVIETTNTQLNYCEEQNDLNEKIILNKDSLFGRVQDQLEVQNRLNAKLNKEKDKYKKITTTAVVGGFIGGVVTCLILTK